MILGHEGRWTGGGARLRRADRVPGILALELSNILKIIFIFRYVIFTNHLLNLFNQS